MSLSTSHGIVIATGTRAVVAVLRDDRASPTYRTDASSPVCMPALHGIGSRLGRGIVDRRASSRAISGAPRGPSPGGSGRVPADRVSLFDLDHGEIQRLFTLA